MFPFCISPPTFPPFCNPHWYTLPSSLLLLLLGEKWTLLWGRLQWWSQRRACMFRVATGKGPYYGTAAAAAAQAQHSGSIVHVCIISVCWKYISTSRFSLEGGRWSREVTRRSEEIQFQNHHRTHSLRTVRSLSAVRYRQTAESLVSGAQGRLYFNKRLKAKVSPDIPRTVGPIVALCSRGWILFRLLQAVTVSRLASVQFYATHQ